MTNGFDESKRKNRKRRIENLEKFGFEPGKLYRFSGRFRKVYRTSNIRSTSYREGLDSYKIRQGDYIMFFDADLWRTSSIERKFVKASQLEKIKKGLQEKGFKIIKVEPYKISRRYLPKPLTPGTAAKHYYISYCKNNKEKYSGRLYIGHGEKFGWINIVQLEKEEILSQFEKVNI